MKGYLHVKLDGPEILEMLKSVPNLTLHVSGALPQELMMAKRPKACPLHFSENPVTWGVLDVNSGSTVRRMTREGKFGKPRKPTKAEIAEWGLSPRTNILSGHKVAAESKRRRAA